MIRPLMLLYAALFTLACNNDAGTTTATDTSSATKEDSSANIAIDLGGCYLRVVERDSLVASLTQTGNSITGKLMFDNYEKDGSTGTVTGTVDKDIIKLIYRFRSEGMNSVSEVFFKITDNGLIHGIGEVAVEGDSAYYSNPGSVRYETNETLRKISCDSVQIATR